MREAFHIFQKDVRRLWPQVAGYLALMCVYAWIDAVLPHHPPLAAAQMALGLILTVSCWYLVAAAIHEDALPGDCQYWLTRPYRWWSLLLAKALFILIVLDAPVCVSQISALAANGFPAVWAGTAVGHQLLFAAFIVVPAAGLAAVTRTLVQFVLGLLAVLAAVAVEFAVVASRTFENQDWGSIDWVRSAFLFTLLFGAVGVVLVLQYHWRRTTVSRIVLPCAALLVPVTMSLPWWHGAWVYQTRRSPQPIAAQAVRISFDAQRGTAKPPGDFSCGPFEDTVGVEIPIRIDGLPAGTQVRVERVQAAIESLGQLHWRSAWRNQGGIVNGPVSLNGPYWAGIHIDGRVFDTMRDRKVNLRVGFALTLYSAADVLRLTIPSPLRRVQNWALCSVTVEPGYATLMCFAPRRYDGATDATLSPLQAGKSTASWNGGFFSAWQILGGTGYQTPVEAIIIENRRAVSYFERSLEIRGIRLRPYETDRSRGGGVGAFTIIP